MKLNLNDSEIMEILSMIDEFGIGDVDPMEKATLLSIVKKINDNVQYKHHNYIDDFCIDVRANLEEDE